MKQSILLEDEVAVPNQLKECHQNDDPKQNPEFRNHIPVFPVVTTREEEDKYKLKRKGDGVRDDSGPVPIDVVNDILFCDIELFFGETSDVFHLV